MVQMFLVAVGDNGQSGDLVGCGDSLVPVQIEIPPSQGVLRASLGTLLSLKDQYYGQSGLYNALYQSDLQIESVTVTSGKAVINLTGTLTLGGECDNRGVAGQLEATARQFQTVTDVTIYINGKLLADASLAKRLTYLLPHCELEACFRRIPSQVGSHHFQGVSTGFGRSRSHRRVPRWTAPPACYPRKTNFVQEWVAGLGLQSQLRFLRR